MAALDKQVHEDKLSKPTQIRKYQKLKPNNNFDPTWEYLIPKFALNRIFGVYSGDYKIIISTIVSACNVYYLFQITMRDVNVEQFEIYKYYSDV